MKTYSVSFPTQTVKTWSHREHRKRQDENLQRVFPHTDSKDMVTQRTLGTPEPPGRVTASATVQFALVIVEPAQFYLQFAGA